MVIEDDFDAAAIMSAALSTAGYEVMVVRDGDMASQELLVQLPHLIALDLHLPGVNGDSLLKQIRNDERLEKSRVMLITADDRLADRVGHDADLVLLKPVSFSQLQLLAQRLFPE
jgi:DNA-binding response OmpR family regulator